MTYDRRGPPDEGDPDATIPVHRPSAPPAPGDVGPRGTYRMPNPTASQSGLDMPESWDLRRSGRDMPAGAGLPAPGHSGPKTSKLPIVLGVVGVLIVSAGAAAVTWSLTSPGPTKPSDTKGAAVTATAEAKPTKPPGPKPRPKTAASTTAPPAKPDPKPAVVAPPENERACFAQLMPKDAFGASTPDLKGACTGHRAYATTLVLKSAVVAAGRNSVTEAMREWSMLGWYETAAFAAMRAHCCPDAKALTVTRTFTECRMEEALAYVANAIDDPAKMKEATDKYHKATMCLTGRGWANAFGRGGPPYGGEMVHFDKVMKRIAKARGR